MPARDAGDTLDPAVASLLGQRHARLELVAVDHASSDSTGPRLRAWAARDRRVRLIRLEKGSLLDALNRGLAACRGNWVARADADDLSRPDRLAAQLRLAREDRLDLVGSQVTLFPRDQVKSGYRYYEKWINSVVSPARIRRDLFVECPLPHPTWLVRRSLYRRLGGYRDDSLPEDYHFLLRAVEAGARLGKVRRRLVAWREHPERHSRNHPRYHLNAFFQLKARYLARMCLPQGRCVVWGIGGRGRRLVKYLRQEGVEVLFGIKDLGDSGNRSLRGAPVVRPDRLPAPLPAPVIACVGTPGAREKIRAWARKARWKEGADILFAN